MSDFTQDEIKAELMRRGALQPEQPAQPMLPPREGSSVGFISHPIDNTMKALHSIQDFAGGLAGGAQRFASTLGETGQAIGDFAAAPFRKYVPESLKGVPNVNIREELGLGQTNPFDLKEAIAHNPNSFAASAGQFALPLLAGGASIPRQMLYNGLWGATQASPDQRNLGGILPSGRIGAGLEDAALTGAGGVAAKEIMGGLPTAKKALDYISPNKDAAKFLQSLGQGTKEENVQALARDIQQSHQANLTDALSHKTPIYKQEAKTNIYETPESMLPEGNLDKVAHYIAPGEKYTPQQLEQLGKEIQNYRKTGDFDDFTHNVQEIFNADMKPVQVKNIENALNIPTETAGKFREMAEKNSKLIEGNTREVYEKFLKKPILRNADKLQSQLGDDWGYYNKLNQEGKLEPALKPRLKQLTDLRSALKEEMQDALNRKNSKYGEEINQFNKKYSENVVPYGEGDFTQNIVNEGKRVKEERAANPNLPYNVTSGEAASYFANPSRAALKVSQDIGEGGRNKILYNLLADDTNPEAKGLAHAILQAKQSKGYSRYITPEIEDLAHQLIKRAAWRKRAQIVGGLAGAGVITEGGLELGKKLF